MCGIMTSWGLEGKKPYGQLYTDVNVFSVLMCILKKKKKTQNGKRIIRLTSRLWSQRSSGEHDVDGHGLDNPSVCVCVIYYASACVVYTCLCIRIGIIIIITIISYTSIGNVRDGPPRSRMYAGWPRSQYQLGDDGFDH